MKAQSGVDFIPENVPMCSTPIRLHGYPFPQQCGYLIRRPFAAINPTIIVSLGEGEEAFLYVWK